MKKLLTLALALVVLAVFTGLGVAQEERKGKGLPSAQEERKEVTQVPPAKVAKACKNKKAGDIVKVDGKDATCQTPAPEVAKACKNKKPGDTVRIGSGKDVQCPPACCYINGCIYPQNRECL